jgi:mono/diheme cytochrome c family protein
MEESRRMTNNSGSSTLPRYVRIIVAASRRGLGTALLMFVPFVMSVEAIASGANPAQGRTLLESSCSRCHAIDLTGASPNADAPPFRIVANRWPPENIAEALAEGIFVGHPSMPEFVLTPTQIGDVIQYLQTLVAE